MNPKRAYQEAAVRGATPVRLTILAAAHLEACAQEIGHAVAVIGYLQATLRQNSGPDVVGNLRRFYTMLRERLMEAQVRSSRPILAELQQQLSEVREAWIKVETDASLSR